MFFLMVRIQIIISLFLLLLILLSDEARKCSLWLVLPTSLETFGLPPLKSLGSDFSRCFVREYVHFGVLCTLNITASGIELSYWRMVSTYPNCFMTYDKYGMILGDNSCLQNMRQLLTKHFCFRFGFSFPYSSWSPGMYPEFKQLICIWLLLMSY